MTARANRPTPAVTIVAMPDPLEYRPPHRDRRQAVGSGEWVLAALMAAAFITALALVIWLLIQMRLR